MKQACVDELIFNAIKCDLGWSVESSVCEEISSGNINYIYRIKNKENKKSVILKFADDATRVRPDGFLSPQRNEHEAEVLKWYGKVVPKYVPQVLCVNSEKHYFLMEDIGDSVSLKDALMKGCPSDMLGEALASFIIQSTFPLLDIVCKDRQVDRPCSLSYSNDLLHITEELVFISPYYNLKNRNRYTAGNERYIKDRLEDCRLQAVVSSLLEKFKTYKQSLIHGDLHTGSILLKSVDGEINSNEHMMDMFVIDPEFAFYGPIAYDVGNVLAHLYFALLYKSFNVSHDEAFFAHLRRYQEQIDNFIYFFKSDGFRVLEKLVLDTSYHNSIFLSRYIKRIIDDAFRYAGCEIVRRVVGSAKVAELESIQDEKIRIPMERILIDLGVAFILYGSKKHAYSMRLMSYLGR